MKLTDRRLPTALLMAMAALALPACAPLVIGAVAAGTAVVVTDRRSTGSQLDDKSIQVRVANELQDALRGNDIHVNVNSFEKRVLLTGEVNSEAIKAQASAVAARSKDVRMVNNELIIAKPSSFGARTEDNTLGVRVRAALVNTREVAFNSIDIVTERQTIYLMGAVTQKEADVAAHVASRVPGVKQVVKLFDVASADEINRGRAAAAPPPAGQSPTAAPAPITTAPATTSPGPPR